MVKNEHGQSGHRTLKLTVSQEELMEQTVFFHADTNSGKLSFQVGLVKNGCGHLVCEVLKFAIL